MDDICEKDANVPARYGLQERVFCPCVIRVRLLIVCEGSSNLWSEYWQAAAENMSMSCVEPFWMQDFSIPGHCGKFQYRAL